MRQSTDVQVVLDGVLELAGKQLQHSHIAVEREWATGLPLIQANVDHLKQVFLNLVLNAIDAMSAQGKGTLRLRTGLDQMQSRDNRPLPAVRIEIGDTGPGIPPESLSRVFEPFMTTKAEGTGLGLSISYGIIEAHGGQITATSQVGVGTTFTILLPVES
jgi:two-component system, NtrC family, sensor kinase